MSAICIIPARGGSKRIPRKNIKEFLGKPIIAYSIEAAFKSKLFDEVMVSTDDPEIAKIAKAYGANVPFMRSKQNSDDFATTYVVIEEVLKEYRKHGSEFEICCCLYSTAPFVTDKKLKKAFDIIQNNEVEAVYTVLPYSYPIQRSLSEDENGFLRMNWKENQTKRSQDLMQNFHDAGQFYFYNSNAFLEKKGVFNMDSKYVLLSELEAQDIDTEIDWKLAELKYKLSVM